MKDFHKVFNEHCKRYFSDEFLFDNCCEEYELHHKVEYVNREESFPHNLQHLSNDLHDHMFSLKHELDSSNEEAEGSPITIISDFHKSEELVSLVMNYKDQFSVRQKFIEIDKSIPQFSDLQIKEICNRHEEVYLQRSSINKEKH